MEKLTPRAFSRLLKKERPNFVLLIGSESAFIRRSLELIQSLWSLPPESIFELDGDETSLEALTVQLASTTIFSNDKMVILKKSGSFLKGLKDREKKSFKELLTKGIPAHVCFVMVEECEDERIQNHPLLKILEEAPCKVVICRKARPKELKAWLSKKLEKLGIKDDTLIESLIWAYQGSTEAIEKELEKLVIDKKSYELTGEKVYTIFELSDLFLEGNPEALEALDFLLKTGTPPQVVLSVIQGSLRNLLLWSQGIKRFPPFVEEKFRKISSFLGLNTIKRLYEESIIVEKKLKGFGGTGLVRNELEALILSSVIRGLEQGRILY